MAPSLKMLNEVEALLANGGYTLKSTTECNGEIFVFLLNESELSRMGTIPNTTTIEEEEHVSE